MAEYSKHYEIFKACFGLPASYESFVSLLSPEECVFVERWASGRLMGFGTVYENRIRLICVAPEFQRKGLGSDILKECEDTVKENGFDKVHLGGGSWLFLGAVLAPKEVEECRSGFFSARGYEITGCCAELSMKSADLDESLIPVPSVEAEFRFVRPEEHDKLIKAVAQVEEDWCQYFTEDSPVFAAFAGGEIASFCIAEDNCVNLLTFEGANIGSVGCVGTVPSMRKKSLGLAMVGKASAMLRDRGCDDIYIHYTHLEKWYGKLGFRPFLYFGFGEKKV